MSLPVIYQILSKLCGYGTIFDLFIMLLLYNYCKILLKLQCGSLIFSKLLSYPRSATPFVNIFGNNVAITTAVAARTQTQKLQESERMRRFQKKGGER